MLQAGNVGQELSLFLIKLITLRRKIIQQFITFESHFRALFPSRIASAPLYVAMTARQIKRIINKNYGNLLRNLNIGINGYKLLILRKIMFSL